MENSKPSGMATTSLVLGILGFILVPLILSILAVIFGGIEWKKQKQTGTTPSVKRGRIGCILGIIGLVWGVVLIRLIS